MSFVDAVETFALTLLGWAMVFASFAWASFDAYSHQGRVGMTTLFGALVVSSVGGVFVSKHKTTELFDFLFTQANRAKDFKFPSVGSDSDK